jgi:ankyrin repeat protein
MIDPVLPWDVRVLSGTLIKTCFRGQWNVATWLAVNAEIDINQTDSNGNTLLHGAVGFCKDKGHTRLHKACQMGDVAEVWRLSDDDVNAQNNYGDTPLHEACRHGYRDIVEMLVRNGCDLSIRNDNGRTPAQHALWLNHGELLTLLEADK